MFVESFGELVKGKLATARERPNPQPSTLHSLPSTARAVCRLEGSEGKLAAARETISDLKKMISSLEAKEKHLVKCARHTISKENILPNAKIWSILKWR